MCPIFFEKMAGISVNYRFSLSNIFNFCDNISPFFLLNTKVFWIINNTKNYGNNNNNNNKKKRIRYFQIPLKWKGRDWFQNLYELLKFWKLTQKSFRVENKIDLIMKVFSTQCKNSADTLFFPAY